MGFFTRISRKDNNKNSYSFKESGNVFLMLFGAVGMVGVIGASTMTVMKGPVRTMSQVTKQTLTENEMIAAGKLAIIRATQNGGDCDSDAEIEPVQMSGTAVPGSSGLEDLPASIGASKEDSWGMPYAYCAWNHGADVNGCGASNNNRLEGTDTGDQYVIAIISAGPDGVFNTTCNDYVDADATPGPDVPLVQKDGGSDDMFLGYRYNEAAVASGGLWNEESSNEASIARDVTIKDSGGADTFAFNATSGELTLAGGIPVLKTDTLQSMNAIPANTDIIVNSPLNSNQNITTSADISGVDLIASGTLDVTGTSTLGVLNAGTTGVSSLTASGAVTGGSLSTGGTLGVTGTSTLGVLNAGVTGVSSLSASGLISTTGNATFGDDISDTLNVNATSTINGRLILNNTSNGLAFQVNNPQNFATAANISSTGSSSNGIQVSASGGYGILGISSNGSGLAKWGTAGRSLHANGYGLLGQNTAGGYAIRSEGRMDMNSNKIENLATPTADTDAATKKYVDDQISGGGGGGATDTRIGDLGTGTAGMNWCTSNGSIITCTAATPSETDPQVGTLTANQWCTANTAGDGLDCTSSAPSGLPSCSAGEIAQFNGSNWACASEADIVNGECTAGVQTWTAQTAAEANNWTSVAYGNGLFVAVAGNGTNRVMISPDGVNWTAQTVPEANTWIDVTYGNGLFVAVATNGTNRVMTSPDGVNWTPQTAEIKRWNSITHGNGLFVAVVNAIGTDRVMISSDGVNWTPQTVPEANYWQAVTYGNGLFVAVAANGTNRVMTSPDGVNWTARSIPIVSGWSGIEGNIVYGNGTFVAGAGGSQIVKSSDGITWTAVTMSGNDWGGLAYGNEKFVAISGSSPHVATADAGSCTSNETDPTIGTLTANQWCTANAAGDGLDCTSVTPNDNLGDHTATQNIDAASNNVTNINMLEFDSVTGDAPVGGSGGAADNLGDHIATQGVVFHKVTGAAAPTK